MSVSPSLLNPILSALQTLYTTASNDVRRNTTNQLLHTLSQLSPQNTVAVGLALLQGSFDVQPRDPIQSYGAVMLRNAIEHGSADCSTVPLAELLTFYRTTPLTRLLGHDIISLIVAGALRTWPETWPDFLSQICPSDLVSQPVLVPLLLQFVEAAVDPPIGKIPTNRMGPLRAAIRRHSNATLHTIITTMGVWYNDYEGNSGLLGSGLNLVAALVPNVSVAEWWELGVDQVVVALMQRPQTSKEACSCFSAMMRSDAAVNGLLADSNNNNNHHTANRNNSNNNLNPPRQPPVKPLEPAVLTRLLKFCEDVLQQIEGLLIAEDWNTVEELVETVHDMPLLVIHSLKRTVFIFCELILRIPSVFLAITVTDIIRKIDDFREYVLNISNLLENLHFFAVKSNVHPAFASKHASNRGIDFSLQQYSTLQAFDVAYAEVRGNIAHLLKSLALMFPRESEGFLLRLIASLPTDPFNGETVRTAFGHVTQQSLTFVQWQSTQFFMEQVTEVLRNAPPPIVEEILQQLVAKRPAYDAVVTPVFLNMIACFWILNASPNAPDLKSRIWRGSLEVIFQTMNMQPQPHIVNQRPPHRRNTFSVVHDDPDLFAARKRGFTIFVHAAVHHGEEMMQNPSLNVFTSANEILLSGEFLVSEKAYIYEALAALTNVLPPVDQMRYLDTIITPMKKIVLSISIAELPNILCGTTRDYDDQRVMLRDAVNVLSGVLRRCVPSEFMRQVAVDIVPVLGDLLLAIHQLTPQNLPNGFQSILEIASIDRAQFLPGNSRRPETDHSNVNRARTILTALRLSLYQSIGTIPKFISIDMFVGAIGQIVQHSETFLIHNMRSLCENALFPLMKHSLVIACSVLPGVTVFLETQMRVLSGGHNPQQDVVDRKQLFYFAKDVLNAVRSVTEEPAYLSSSDVQQSLEVPIVNLLNVVIRSTFEPKGAAIAALRMMDLPTTSEGAVAALFSTLVMSTAANTEVNERDRMTIAGMICDTFLKRSMLLTPVLLNYCGVSQASMDSLVAVLSLAPRVDVKRKKFFEFLVSSVAHQS